jgi:hypothetical protein
MVTLTDQPDVFGAMASDSTCWRMLDARTTADLGAIFRGADDGPAMCCGYRGRVTGQHLPASLCASRPFTDAAGGPGLVLDDDATIVITHSERSRPPRRSGILLLPPVAGSSNGSPRGRGR